MITDEQFIEAFKRSRKDDYVTELNVKCRNLKYNIEKVFEQVYLTEDFQELIAHSHKAIDAYLEQSTSEKHLEIIIQNVYARWFK